MAKRTFEVTFTGTAIIELDDDVINAVNTEWRDTFYNLNTTEQIAEHIAFNLIVNNSDLDDLDGFADQPEDNARIVENVEWDIEADEIDL